MPRPQPGIFTEGTAAHRFQEYDIARAADADAIRTALAAVVDRLDAAGTDDLQAVVGFGADLARRLGMAVPGGFRSYETIGVGERTAPATQHDLFVWFQARARTDLFDAALGARRAITEVGAIVGDLPAFVYRDGRDLTRCIDGTENPSADEGRQLAVVADGRPGSGGSLVLVQRWIHDLDRFHALPVAEQEQIIGRTKPDSVELAQHELPENAHISRVVMEDEHGDEVEIYRRSVPWGDSTDSGLMFIGFSDELTKIDDMLHAMFGTVDGIHDRLTECSRARSSSYYFAPDQETLSALVAGFDS
jgi:putative iron-dependent peroxidase